MLFGNSVTNVLGNHFANVSLSVKGWVVLCQGWQIPFFPSHVHYDILVKAAYTSTETEKDSEGTYP